MITNRRLAEERLTGTKKHKEIKKL